MVIKKLKIYPLMVYEIIMILVYKDFLIFYIWARWSDFFPLSKLVLINKQNGVTHSVKIDK